MSLANSFGFRNFGRVTANANTVTLENEQDATDKVSLLTGRQIVPTGGG